MAEPRPDLSARNRPRAAGPNLTSGSIAGALWRLGLPIMLANGVTVVIALTDSKFVSWLGETELAAVGLSRQVMFLLGALFIGVGAGSTAMVARAVGAEDTARANHVVAQALVLAVLLSVVLATMGWILAPVLLHSVSAPQDVFPLALVYLRIIFVGVVFMLLLFVTIGILRGAGDAVTPLKLTALAAGLNILFDALLIFGLFGLPALGVAGAALASVLAHTVAAAVGIVVLASGRLRLHLHLRDFAFDPAVLWRMAVIGVPASVQLSLRALMTLVLMAFVAGFGEAELAAFSVGIVLQQIAFMPTLGLADASGALVGQNLGAGKPARAGRSALTGMVFCAGEMALAGGFYALAAPWLMGAFGLDGQALETGVAFLHITAISLVFSGIGISLSRALAGAGDTSVTMVLTVVALWFIQVPLAWYWKGTDLGVNGIWWAIVVAATVQGTLTAAYFMTGRWKTAKA
jgi:putative MATE family efflux protein